MIKVTKAKPTEVEYIEFKGYENFREVCDFVGFYFLNIKLEVNRHGNEIIKTETGIYETGFIFYRYLDTEEYEYDVMPKDKFFRIYGQEGK